MRFALKLKWCFALKFSYNVTSGTSGTGATSGTDGTGGTKRNQRRKRNHRNHMNRLWGGSMSRSSFLGKSNALLYIRATLKEQAPLNLPLKGRGQIITELARLFDTERCNFLNKMLTFARHQREKQRLR